MSKKKKQQPAVSSTPAPTPVSRHKVASPAAGSPMTYWLIALVAILPILFSDKTMDPTISVRYIALSVFALAFVVYFFMIKKNNTVFVLPPLNKIVLIVALMFAGWNVVVLTAATNFHEGFFEIARHLLFVAMLLIAWIATAGEEQALLKLCKALVLVSIFQSLAGILQFYEIGFTSIPGANAKPYGLMANRNLFGSAQVLLIPFVLYVLYKATSIWKYLTAVALVLLAVSILLSQTRSAWLATIAVIVVSLLLVIIFSSVNRRKWLLGTAVAIIASTALVFVILSADSDGALKQSVEQRAKSFTSSDTSATADESIYNSNERLKIWSKTIELIKDRPLMGAGPGNWRITVPVYGTEGLVWAYGKYAPDQPHNVYLHVAAETGIPGAILYFGMWLLIATAAMVTIIKTKNEDHRVLSILMLAGLAALATDMMFSFPTQRIEHTLYIALMGGIILGLHALNASTEKKLTIKKPLLYAALLILVVNVYIGYKKYSFETHMVKAKQYEAGKQFQQVIDEVEAGKSSIVTLGPDVGTSLQIRSSNAYREMKEMDKALAEVKIAKKYHPNSPAVYNTLGTIYTDLGQFDKAIEAYQQGLKIAPYHDVLLKNLAVNYFSVKNFPACIATIDKMPKDADSSYFISMKAEALKYVTAK